MNPIRISVTDLDALAYYHQSDDMDLDTIKRRLRKKEPPTPQLLSGRGFHLALEQAATGDELGVIERDGYTFDFTKLDAELSLPPVREKFITGHLHVSGMDVELRGKIDGDDGLTVYDHKATGQFDPDSYTDSYQWRAYLFMTGRQRFQHNVFTRKIKGDTVQVTGLHTLVNYAYPGMDQDLYQGVRDYLLFAMQHLPEKFSG